MRESVISVTQAARTFADCVNRVRYQSASFVLHKNGVPVARLVPVEVVSDTHSGKQAEVLCDEHEALQNEKEEATTVLNHDEQLKNVQPSALPRRPVLNW
jgi:antitoxin (DNA-binding transcriptional repressor) of toxin-antitoxin stability system